MHTTKNDGWTHLIDAAEAAWAAREAAAVRDTSLRTLERRLRGAAAERHQELIRRIAEVSHIDLSAHQAEHDKANRLRARERQRVRAEMQASLAGMQSLRRPMQATLATLRRNLPAHSALFTSPLTAAEWPGPPALACIPEVRRDFTQQVFTSGPSCTEQAVFRAGQKLLRAKAAATDSSVCEMRYGWTVTWESPRPGWLTVGTSQMIAGVVEASCGTTCGVTAYAANARLSTAIGVQVFRNDAPVVSAALMPVQTQTVRRAGATEGQTRMSVVQGHYAQEHPPILVQQGDRVVARAGVQLLVGANGPCDAEVNLFDGQEAGHELACVWMIVDSTP